MTDEERREVEALESRLRQAQDALHRQGELLTIEKKGREACSTGVRLDENPFTDENDRLMWANGWSQEHAVDHLSRCVAVMKWAIQSLESTIEVSIDSGSTEVTSKLRTISNKMAEYIEEVL